MWSVHQSELRRTRLAANRNTTRPAAHTAKRTAEHTLPRMGRGTPPEIATDSRPLIVIDPGHGGMDSGAVSRSGTLEKDVTLAEARELRRLLLASGRYRVVLTRIDDRYVSLAKRLALTSVRGVTLLISLHADASPDRDVRGASVCIRSGANASPKLDNVGGPRTEPRAIAGALAAQMSDPEPDSEFLQAKVIDSLDGDIKMTDAPMRADRLYVLANSNTPSVLVETGFISSRKDEALLKSYRYQHTIASAILDALDDYFR